MQFPDDFDVDAFIAPLKEKHGDVVAIMTACGPAAFKAPDAGQFARYQSLIFEASTRPQAGQTLALMCVVSPAREVFSDYLKKKPGIVFTCVNPILELAGVDTEASVKKG